MFHLYLISSREAFAWTRLQNQLLFCPLSPLSPPSRLRRRFAIEINVERQRTLRGHRVRTFLYTRTRR